MKTTELRQKSTTELTHELSEAEKRLFTARMDLATRKNATHHLIRGGRKDVARLQTLLAEKKREEAPDA